VKCKLNGQSYSNSYAAWYPLILGWRFWGIRRTCR